ncbi:MAG: hypothetical protein JWQ09_251 [Segetibacter sp.]|nr:hypothetical protein [Segetibacter sp.]
MRLIILTLSLMFLSCGQSDTSQKDTETKTSNDTAQVTQADTTKSPSSDQALPTPKVPLTRASNVTPQCNNDNAPTGSHPLIDLYCAALGKKPIEIYITGVDEPSKTVQGYSMVGNSRTFFEGSFKTKEHKAASHQADNVVDVASTIYTLILREPSQVNTNGVFNIEIDISDIGRSGYGTWTSYNGMLYREIKIIDRLNDL